MELLLIIQRKKELKIWKEMIKYENRIYNRWRLSNIKSNINKSSSDISPAILLFPLTGLAIFAGYKIYEKKNKETVRWKTIWKK